MDVQYTDINGTPIGVLSKYTIDLEIGGENDFEIQLNIKNDCMVQKSLWYISGTEYGGIVDNVKIDTSKGIVYYTGRSWRGIFEKKIIEPKAGTDHYSVSGEANDILWEIVQKLYLVDVFEVSNVKTDFQINNYKFDRYVDAYSGIVKMLESVGAKISIEFHNSKLVLAAVPILDLSEKYEYSDDYGMKIIMERCNGGVNHLICLGNGQLTERTIIHLYVDGNGNISEKQAFFGIDEITDVYDYGNVESNEELMKNGIANLEKIKSKDTISAQFQKLDVTVGDVVGGKNRLTNMYIKEKVTKEIVKIKNDSMTITYEVGEE